MSAGGRCGSGAEEKVARAGGGGAHAPAGGGGERGGGGGGGGPPRRGGGGGRCGGIFGEGGRGCEGCGGTRRGCACEAVGGCEVGRELPASRAACWGAGGKFGERGVKRMGDGEVTQEEWRKAYDILLERLRTTECEEICREIEAAAVLPFFVDEEEDDVAGVARHREPGVGRQMMRRALPSEAFAVALEVLWARLVEFPAVIAAIQKNVGGDKRRIVLGFEDDDKWITRGKKLIELEEFGLTDDERTSIKSAFATMGFAPGARER